MDVGTLSDVSGRLGYWNSTAATSASIVTTMVPTAHLV